jgi:hypothetical protein
MGADTYGTDSLTTVWNGIAAFFIVSFLIPLAPSPMGLVFSWDLFGLSPIFAALALYVLIAGIALAIASRALAGLSRGAAIAALGAVGAVILVAVAASGGGPGVSLTAEGWRAVVVLVGLLALVLALAGNNARIHFRDSDLARLFGGIAAIVAGAIIAVDVAIDTTEVVDLFRSPLGRAIPVMFWLYPIVSVLFELAMVGSCVMIVVNMGRVEDPDYLAAGAQTIAFLGAGLFGAWMVMGTSFLAARMGAGGATGWVFLGLLRFFGFFFGLAFMIGGGTAELMRDALGKRAARREITRHSPE